MKRVLITGARGLVGRPSLLLLQARGWEVIGVATAAEAPFVRADVMDDDAMRALIDEVRPTHLLHAAWKPVRGDVMNSPDNLRWLEASLRLVRRFYDAGGRRAAVIGSSAEYDWTFDGILRNSVTPLRPATIYGACKHAMHVALESYARAIGRSFVWPRLFFVYGPREHESRLAAYVIRSLLRGEPAECTHGLQVRDYLHVDDVAAGVVAALESDYDGAVDIATGRGIAVRDFASAIARAVGREDLLRLGARPSPAYDVPMVVGDPAEAERVIGWKPKIGLEDGIADMVAWGRQAFGAR